MSSLIRFPFERRAADLRQLPPNVTTSVIILPVIRIERFETGSRKTKTRRRRSRPAHLVTRQGGEHAR